MRDVNAAGVGDDLGHPRVGGLEERRDAAQRHRDVVVGHGARAEGDLGRGLAAGPHLAPLRLRARDYRVQHEPRLHHPAQHGLQTLHDRHPARLVGLSVACRGGGDLDDDVDVVRRLERRPGARGGGQMRLNIGARHVLERLHLARRLVLQPVEERQRRVHRGRGHHRRGPRARGVGNRRTTAAVTSPSVPSAPTKRSRRSKPEASSRTDLLRSSTRPPAGAASTPRHSARAEPWRSAPAPPALVGSSPPPAPCPARRSSAGASAPAPRPRPAAPGPPRRPRPRPRGRPRGSPRSPPSAPSRPSARPRPARRPVSPVSPDTGTTGVRASDASRSAAAASAVEPGRITATGRPIRSPVQSRP